jgi:FkbM family methyltransferase
MDILNRISQKLSEGRIKESLRSIYWKYHNPMYQLNKMVDRVTVVEDNQLLLELKDGTKYFGKSDEFILPALKYGNLTKMGILKDYIHFSGFLWVLEEHYIDNFTKADFAPHKGQVVIDIGANIGVFTVKSAKEVGPTGRVIAIEPEPNNIRLLEKNISINKLTNVTVIAKGLWSHPGTMPLNISPSFLGHSFFRDRSFLTEESKNEELVSVDTLDNILRVLDVKKVDLIKLDVEGSEIEVLKGSSASICKNCPKILGECHSINNVNSFNGIKNILYKSGYRVKNKNGLFYGTK